MYPTLWVGTWPYTLKFKKNSMNKSSSLTAYCIIDEEKSF
jgi:hypothetical protein